jgi:hypothetical protein
MSAALDLARWLVSLDDADPNGDGRRDRQTVTLTQIIDRARAVVDEYERADVIVTWSGKRHLAAAGRDTAVCNSTYTYGRKPVDGVVAWGSKAGKPVDEIPWCRMCAKRLNGGGAA